MQKQFLLAIVLSFLVIYGWQALFPPARKAPPAQQQVTAAPSGTQAPGAPQAAAAEAAAPIEVAAAPLVSSGTEQDVVVDTPSVTAIFNTRGAVLKSWRLKNYRDGLGAPLELIPQNVPNAPKPFTLEADEAATSTTLKNALYKPSAETLSVNTAPATLVFEYTDAAGLAARKEFTFNPSHPYVVHFVADVSRNGTKLSPTVDWGPALGTGVVAGGMNYAPAPQPIFYRDRKVSRVGISDIDKHRQEQGAFGFAGVDDHYFLSAIVPSAEPVQVNYSPTVVPVPGQTSALQFISWSVKSPSAPVSADFFFGPKDLDVLQNIKPDLVRAIDFGMFDFLVVPLLRALKWVNSYVGNYGWSIIVLTIIINIVMFPLKHKSIVSMRKMQELQPQMKAIQDRYAKLKLTDPGRQKMNEEVMALYKQHGTNPASGCVPMLLSMPVLVAFYAMLSVAIELRGAPFVGWIKDLSAFDPYFVTPVLMGATMFAQQKMTPMAIADPVQAKMMMFMPLMFTGMLMWAPSGLVLYWTASNLWAIGQQVLTNRLIGPPPQHNVRPPAERQIKSAGAGKSSQAKERK
jgi:YidC/Oxa1 family membrane protein insertase